MTEHPAAVLTVALIVGGLLFQFVIWGWTQQLKRRDHFYVIRRRGRIVGKRR